MRDVFGMSCDPRPARHPATGAGGRRFGYVAPTLAATVIAALILHLLAELGSRLDADDPAGALSVLLGAAAVLVTLAPFAMLFALRARRAWLAGMAPDGRPQGPALASGGH
ncbi:hypothetical protein [Azospirillum sp.]|uniref:hypothetical protein n=1 Tax=Azospirillum sp. TaxID=34012 RepID=UPI003D705507